MNTSGFCLFSKNGLIQGIKIEENIKDVTLEMTIVGATIETVVGDEFKFEIQSISQWLGTSQGPGDLALRHHHTERP